MRVAVTGAGGRLGRALVAALEDAPFAGPFGPIAWDRLAFDLDAPAGIDSVIDRDRPETIIHAAAWTDVDACARDPELALARNGTATGLLATACATRGIDLIVVSTNEVFDGRRTDGRGYGPDDETDPLNSYGESKLAGERAAASAFAATGTSAALGIVRTAWLFGPPGNDFPSKILAAAERSRDGGEPLRVVSDEIGSPTYTRDLAEGIVELIGGAAIGGIHHVVNAGAASRADWARELLRQAACRQCPRRRAGGPDRRRAGLDMVAGIHASGVGRARPDAAPRRRTASAVAAGVGRLPADAAPAAGRGRSRPVTERPSSLRGVRFGALTRHADARGSFRELWRDSAFPALTAAETGGSGDSEPRFVQANLSTSAAGVLRGLHYHRRQLDYWVVVGGRALVALVDVRPLIEGTGDRPIIETRELAVDEWVVIPAGVAHGFLALEPLDLLYLVTNEFDGSDELGFAWDDPAVGVPWPPVEGTPDGQPILSDRDRSNPSLADLVERLRG